jgi:hypothetical protein
MSRTIGGLLCTAAMLTGAMPTWAEEGKVPPLPAEGSTKYTTYYIADPVERLVWGDVGASGTGLATGITRNDEGQPFFDGMSVRCINHWTVLGDEFNVSGACTETDRDGDQVFSTFDDQEHQIVGDVLQAPAEGVVAAIVPHDVTWQIEK